MKTARTTLARAVALATAVSASLLALPAAQVEPLAERQQRFALELKAENLLVKLHDAHLDGELEPCINGAVSPSGCERQDRARG